MCCPSSDHLIVNVYLGADLDSFQVIEEHLLDVQAILVVETGTAQSL